MSYFKRIQYFCDTEKKYWQYEQYQYSIGIIYNPE